MISRTGLTIILSNIDFDISNLTHVVKDVFLFIIIEKTMAGTLSSNEIPLSKAKVEMPKNLIDQRLFNGINFLNNNLRINLLSEVEELKEDVLSIVRVLFLRMNNILILNVKTDNRIVFQNHSQSLKNGRRRRFIPLGAKFITRESTSHHVEANGLKTDGVIELVNRTKFFELSNDRGDISLTLHSRDGLVNGKSIKHIIPPIYFL